MSLCSRCSDYDIIRKPLLRDYLSSGFLYIFSRVVFSKSVNKFIIGLTESVNGGYAMNERFFSLPAEKQQAIINAGYRVFSQNSKLMNFWKSIYLRKE